MEVNGFYVFSAWVVIYLGWNIATFLIMGFDKFLAKANKRRISEKTLLLTAFFMGGFGSWCGSKVFRHKTQKTKFKILLPVSILVNIAAIVGIIYLKIQI